MSARTHSLEGGRRIPRVATQSDHRHKSLAAVVHDGDVAHLFGVISVRFSACPRLMTRGGRLQTASDRPTC